jgi:hypothetical protein
MATQRVYLMKQESCNHPLKPHLPGGLSIPDEQLLPSSQQYRFHDHIEKAASTKLVSRRHSVELIPMFFKLLLLGESAMKRHKSPDSQRWSGPSPTCVKAVLLEGDEGAKVAYDHLENVEVFEGRYENG